MCANYQLAAREHAALAERFEAIASDWINTGIEEKKNGRTEIYPGYEAFVVHSHEGKRLLSPDRGGFLPHWAKDAKHKRAPFNAVSETVLEKPMFASSFKTRRCLIPATGFYDYRAADPMPKMRFLFSAPDEPLFALAGFWNEWCGELRTFTMLTTEPNEFMKQYHHRMPVILPPPSMTAGSIRRCRQPSWNQC